MGTAGCGGEAPRLHEICSRIDDQHLSMGYKSLIVLALILLYTIRAEAQDRRGAIESLPATSQAAVVTENIWGHIPSTRVQNGRIDEELGIFRAVYQLNPTITPEATAEATARKWLADDGTRFGIGTPDVLELVNEKQSFGAQHLTFQQTLAGVKVYGRFVHVNLDKTGLPVMAISGYAPHLEGITSFNPVPALNAAQAESLAQRAVSETGASSRAPELLILPDNPPRLVWRVIVWPDSYPGEWEVVLDANTGALIHLMDLRVFSRAHTEDLPVQQAHLPDPEETNKRTSGYGWIWMYDPLTASGQPYGRDYVDNNDQDSDALTGLLTTETLWNIDQNSNDGLYRLNGPWVRIVGPYAPEESDENNFKYTRNDKRFEAVMSYYFIDQSQRYIQDLNLGHPVPSTPIRVDPHASPEDQSYFQYWTNSLHFGDGGVDDAEDAGVILHEYGHAIMYEHMGFPTLNSGEQGVLAEGFSDYWAVSYRRHLMESGQVPMGDWREVFPWDGVFWGGRRADGDDHYDTIEQDCRDNCSYYNYARTWSALMMQLWERIGRETTDRLHVAAFPYLAGNFTLADMVQALVLADDALYDKLYFGQIYDIFARKGFFGSTVGIPIITHTPPQRHTDLSTSVQFEANIEAPGFPIIRAAVVFRLNSGNFLTADMINESQQTWKAEAELPPNTQSLEYYIQASTEIASINLPVSAPRELFSVKLGSDTQAPEIFYTPVTHVTPEQIPLTVSVQVTDNEAVSKVEFQYTKTLPNDQGTESGTLLLRHDVDDTYSGIPALTSNTGEPVPGTWMEYRILAYDEADPPNIAHFPLVGEAQLRLDVIPGPNELGAWNSSEWSELTSGEWAPDDSIFGYKGPLWVTVPDAPYSDMSALSLLSMPEVNVAGYPDAHLEFWHWYDFEHTGVPGPGDVDGVVYDGGQIQISTDGGQSWTVAEPQWGYNGVVDDTRGNPLSGTSAFGGSSFGWRRVRVPLPDAPEDVFRFEVSARLAFGAGNGNSESTTHNFAGWAVRDVRVLADPPADQSPPTILYAPFAHRFIKYGEPSTHIQMAVEDDTGIESIRLNLYEVRDSHLEPLGVYRFRPILETPDWFYADVPVPSFQQSGVLGYHITVRDFDGNIRTPGGDPPGTLLRLYLTTHSPVAALYDAHTSGDWEVSDSGYLATTGTSHQQSAIVLRPVYFSENSQRTMLLLLHTYHLNQGTSAHVSVTEDGGYTWTRLVPSNGYPAMTQSGEGVFAGESPSMIESWFDLGSLKQPYQLRLDLTNSGQQANGSFWKILNAGYYLLPEDTPVIPTPTDIVLYPNFPNPFKGQTNISYVLPETMPVRIKIFNILGQEVQSVVDRVHEAGGYAVNVDMSRLAPGTYWIRMEAGTDVYQQSMTLVR